jgi:hypothetical protein
MKNFAIATGAAGVLAAVAFGSAAAAGAAPTGPGSASEVVKSLQDQGYNVQLNGIRFGSLSDCSVTAIHNPDATGQTTPFTTVYVDISCPSNNT